MANELSMQLQSLLRYTGVSDQYASGSKVVNQANQYFIKGIQNIGFAIWEAIDVGAEITIGNIGYTVFQNLDATNYVQIGVWTGAAFVPGQRLLPGEISISRWSQSLISLPYAYANTAAVNLFYTIYAD
jgi:hypothetical protein